MKPELLTETLPLRLSRSLRDKLRSEATVLGLKMNTYIRQIIDRRNGKG